MGRQDDQVGRFLPGLPDGFRRFDAKLLGRFIFCQYNAVARVRIAAHRHRHILQCRIAQQLYRREKAV